MCSYVHYVQESELGEYYFVEEIIAELEEAEKPRECVFVLDFTEIEHLPTSKNTNFIIERFLNTGISQIVIKNFKNKGKLPLTKKIKYWLDNKFLIID